jgi:hypothetical protein
MATERKPEPAPALRAEAERPTVTRASRLAVGAAAAVPENVARTAVLALTGSIATAWPRASVRTRAVGTQPVGLCFCTTTEAFGRKRPPAITRTPTRCLPGATAPRGTETRTAVAAGVGPEVATVAVGPAASFGVPASAGLARQNGSTRAVRPVPTRVRVGRGVPVGRNAGRASAARDTVRMREQALSHACEVSCRARA